MERTLYCLKLEGGRFYVGQTPKGRFATRLREHERYNGAKWTSRFKPKEVLWTRTVDVSDVKHAEDAACCDIMRRHGINSCRGGLFNIGSDVREMPWWAQPIYRQYEKEILRAGP